MDIDNTIINSDVADIITTLKTDLSHRGVHKFAKMFDSGDDLMVCCPFHKDGQERRPSAGIRKSDGMFHCLACGETHSLSELIAYTLGYSDPEVGRKWLIKNFASTEVYERGDVVIDCSRGSNANVRNVGITEVTEAELDSYRYIHPYMYQRGLTDEIIELFDLGYDRNTNSITFPVRQWCGEDFGKTLFIARRHIKTKRFDLPKGLDKPLYGLYELIQGGISYNEIYVCEGPFDMLRFWCNNKYAVAGFGCLFSEYQIKLINSLPTRTIIVATDNDEAGKKAAERLNRQIKGKLIYRAIFPEGKKDPGECTDDEINGLEVEML